MYDEYVGRKVQRSNLGNPTGVDPENVLPLVDFARWSTNVEVRGLFSLHPHNFFPPCRAKKKKKNQKRSSSPVSSLVALSGGCESCTRPSSYPVIFWGEGGGTNAVYTRVVPP